MHRVHRVMLVHVVVTYVLVMAMCRVTKRASGSMGRAPRGAVGGVVYVCDVLHSRVRLCTLRAGGRRVDARSAVAPRPLTSADYSSDRQYTFYIQTNRTRDAPHPDPPARPGHAPAGRDRRGVVVPRGAHMRVGDVGDI